MPGSVYVCVRLAVPAPDDSDTVAPLEVVSPQSTDAVWVSWVPASAKVSDAVTGLPTAWIPGLTDSDPAVGARFPTVMMAMLVTGGLIPSLTVSVAVTVASSLHDKVGVSVAVPPVEQAVPGLAATTKLQEMASGFDSGSVAEPASVSVEPSATEYGPLAAAVGGRSRPPGLAAAADQATVVIDDGDGDRPAPRRG